MTREEKFALDKTRLSLIHDGERYQVATPWKTDCPMLPNNYEMANSRLRNREKRLIRQPLVGEDYQRVITSYVDKRVHPQGTADGEQADKYLVPSSLPSMPS